MKKVFWGGINSSSWKEDYPNFVPPPQGVPEGDMWVREGIEGNI